PKAMSPLIDTCLSRLSRLSGERNCWFITVMTITSSVSPTSGRNLSIIVFTESLLFIQLSSCSQGHNVFLVDLAALQYAAEPSFLHYRNPVRQPDDLRHFRLDQDDRHAAFRQLVDQ